MVCGFIGSNFMNLIHKTNKYNIINFDAMYYCATLMLIKKLENLAIIY